MNNAEAFKLWESIAVVQAGNSIFTCVQVHGEDLMYPDQQLDWLQEFDFGSSIAQGLFDSLFLAVC